MTNLLKIDMNALNGVLVAHELLLRHLLKVHVELRLPDKGQDTEHLDAFVCELHSDFSAQLPNMSREAAKAAEAVVLRVLAASCQKYWKKVG
jgi:hypothetical protein